MSSDFIDFSKRSVSLPSGCKDLADVLAKKGVRQREGSLERQSPISEGNFSTSSWKKVSGNLADLETYCARLFANQTCQVSIKSNDKPFEIHLYRVLPDADVTANIEYRAEADLEAAVSSFLERHDLLPQAVSDLSLFPSLFFSWVPVQNIHEMAPLPSSALELSILLRNFFREVCGMEEENMVQYTYRKSPELTPGDEPLGTLADLGNYCARILSSGSQGAFIHIRLPEMQFAALLFRAVARRIAVSINFPMDHDLKAKVSKFLERHGLSSHIGSFSPRSASGIFPIPSKAYICQISPAPPNAAELTSFLKGFFREVCNANEQTPAYYRSQGT